MELKFYLNKFVKADNIEGYTLSSLKELKSSYDKFLEDSDGVDPDFPEIKFGTKGKSVVKGKTNVEKLSKPEKSEIESIILGRSLDH